MFSCGAKGNEDASCKANNGTRAVVLQRGHGFTAIGGSIEESVYRAIYTQEAAEELRWAMQLRQANGMDKGGVMYLGASEVADALTADSTWLGKAWPFWVDDVGKRS
jgi:ribulose-5-phosphate 4-epimerase/fuculose-1-phosphate aldolase